MSVDDSSVSLSVVIVVSQLITEEKNLKLKQMSYCKFDIDKNVIRVGFEKKKIYDLPFSDIGWAVYSFGDTISSVMSGGAVSWVTTWDAICWSFSGNGIIN